jgi:signal peptidase II
LLGAARKRTGTRRSRAKAGVVSYNACEPACPGGSSQIKLRSAQVQNAHTRVWAVPLLTAAVVLTLDQITKAWVVATLGPETMSRFIPIAGDTVRIAYSHNTGVAFSMFQGHPELLTVAAVLIIAGAIYFYATQLPNHRTPIQLIMGLIMGGAFGNLVDRIRLGYVVDFIQVGWFPIFNIADSAISVGAGLLMLQFIRDELAQRRSAGDEQALTSQ